MIREKWLAGFPNLKRLPSSCPDSWTTPHRYCSLSNGLTSTVSLVGSTPVHPSNL
jgi:hypothetical protein